MFFAMLVIFTKFRKIEHGSLERDSDLAKRLQSIEVSWPKDSRKRGGKSMLEMLMGGGPTSLLDMLMEGRSRSPLSSLAESFMEHMEESHDCDSCPKSGDCPIEDIMRKKKEMPDAVMVDGGQKIFLIKGEEEVPSSIESLKKGDVFKAVDDGKTIIFKDSEKIIASDDPFQERIRGKGEKKWHIYIKKFEEKTEEKQEEPEKEKSTGEK